MKYEGVIMNNASIEYYEKKADEYVLATINADVSRLYKEFEGNIKKGCRILDIGCGSGRDSKYFIEKGYDVVAIDPSPTMCEKTKMLSGVVTYIQRAEELEFENEFDAVWACASLLHVSRENQRQTLILICRSLKPEGILYCSWKYGTQDREENGRHFTDLNERELLILLSDISNFKLIKMWRTDDARPENKQQWLNVLLRKDCNVINRN